MTAKELFDAIGELPEEMVREAETVKKPKIGWVAAAVAAIAAVAVLFLLPRGGKTPAEAISLSERSKGFTVSYVERLPNDLPRSEACLAWFTEDELLNNFDTLIFRGRVQSLRNLAVDVEGERLWWSIAEIEVLRVLRGEAAEGETLRVLMQVPFVDGVRISGADTLYQLREGMEGIFMPRVYEDSDVYRYGGAELCLTDLAPCGFPDGVRFAFLQTEEGLVFPRDSWPSLAEAETLDELESALGTMLE